MILLMGIAGSGKGTQGKMLADNNGFHLIAMGDVIREYATDKQRERMMAGGLLDDQEVIAMIDKMLLSLPQDEEVILDGFPRTIPQAEWLIGQVKAGRFQLNHAIHLVASREAVKERLLGRARADDNDAAIEERFNEYERSTAPILDWLANNGIEVENIDAIRSVEDVYADIANHVTKS